MAHPGDRNYDDCGDFPAPSNPFLRGLYDVKREEKKHHDGVNRNAPLAGLREAIERWWARTFGRR